MTVSNHSAQTIVIVGAGFAGIGCALRLAKEAKSHNLKIKLISSEPHFEYHAALYRVVTGRSPLEVCIPLADIFEGKPVEVVEDKITGIDPDAQVVTGASGSTYSYHTLVLTLGSQPNYYGTPGLQENSFSVWPTCEALRLKRHLHESVATCLVDEERELCNSHLVVVGAGPTGTEAAGELAVYVKDIATKHGVDPSLVTIDLIQSSNRLVKQVPPAVSALIEKQIRSLGVNVYLNRRLLKRELEHTFLSDMNIETTTVIWTAGTKANELYQNLKGASLARSGQVEVSSHLRAKGFHNVYVAGDGAALPDSGMALPALRQGRYVAAAILSERSKKAIPAYQPQTSITAIPVGPNWAAVVIGPLTVTGRIGWWLRRCFDLWAFCQLLPWNKALTAFKDGGVLCETCRVCCNES